MLKARSWPFRPLRAGAAGPGGRCAGRCRFFLELADQVIHHALVEVIAAQEGVAAGRAHLEDAIAHIEDRDIEGAAAQVVHGDDFVLLLVQPVGQRRSGRLVDDAQHFQPGDLAGVFGGVALGIVEVSRHGDDRLGDGSPR
jgi:hypothetical protein